MVQYIAIFIGGGLGSLCRFVLSRYNLSTGLLPWGTILANFSSCLLLGITVAFLANKPINTHWAKPFIAVGFCGGFSTFSTFSLETFELLRNGQTFTAFLQVSSSIFVCLFAIFIGFTIYRFFQ